MTAGTLTATTLADAKRLHRAGRLKDAEAAYRAALAGRPDDAEALHLLAVLLDQRGDDEGALVLLERALIERPGFVAARINLARLFMRRGLPERAEQHLRHVLDHTPGHVEARFALAGALHRRRKLAEAIAEYRAVLAAAPDHQGALNDLGAALQESGQAKAAEPHLRRLLEINPKDREALNNLGSCLVDLKRPEEAVGCFRRALAIAPGDAQVQANLGNALQTLGDADGARTAYRHALAQRRADGLKLRLAAVLPAIPDSADAMRAARAEAERIIAELEGQALTVHDPVREVGATHFHLAYHGCDDRDFAARLARLHARACPSLLFRAPHCRRAARPRGRRIRVGFVSSCLRDHTIGRLNRGLIAGLDRERFEVAAVVTAPAGDPIARAIHASAERALVLPPDLDGARRAIAEAEFDILYFTDIGMAPFTYFLAFARLAPVQAVTWGHPVTTGVANLDYFVSCAAAEPEDAAHHYGERLIELPVMSNLYTRPLPPPRAARAELGLPEAGAVYLCPQSLFKLHPDFDAVLAAILERDPEGGIVLLAPEQPTLGARLLARLSRRIPPAALKRVRFAPRLAHDRFLALIAAADVMLDPVVFGGGNTSYEAFALGTPVVTLPGMFLRGRLTLGQYRQMGFEDLVARDPAHYVDLAVGLGRDPDRRAAARAVIVERCPALFDNRLAVTEHERFFLEAVGG